ncbi:MAG: hypothetical protein II248_07725 [Paludibacteraceae bacterium]|nr:hypothetical protein [Paludibacteraceae bacterium]
MAAVLIILAIVFMFICVSLHNKADKLEENFKNRPSIITSPANDLSTNQKYAIINILAFVQGANSVSAYSNEANDILNKWLSKLGLSKADAERSIRLSMSFSPEKSIRIITDSIAEIKDKAFVRSVYRDAERIAQISGDEDTIAFTNELFNGVLTD